MWICDKDEHCIDCPRNYPNEKCEHYIEVQAIKQGWWISQEYMSEIDSFIYKEYKCSTCGEISKKKSNYCPNCGTAMIGEEEIPNATQYTECMVKLYTETKLRFVLDECIKDEKLIEKILQALDKVEE